MNGYELSRKWFDFCFENPEKVKPIHTSLYFFAIEHCNRLGWKKKFGLPTEMSKDAIGVKSWHTYIKAFNDLIEWGFFILIERSKNQYSSNIIELSKYDKALDKALDKAITKHASKQVRSTHQSIDSIIKQLTKEQLTNKQIESLKKIILDKEKKEDKIPMFDEFKNYVLEKEPNIDLKALKHKYDSWIENDWKTGKDKKITNWKTTILNTLQYLPVIKSEKRSTKLDTSKLK